MKNIGIIGGTGLTSVIDIDTFSKNTYNTPYGETNAPLITGTLADKKIIFLERHGAPHIIPPHMINYRANLYTLKKKGANKIISINAVGGITRKMRPGTIVVPDQIIDYTYSREHTFFDNRHNENMYTDFTHPYNDQLRKLIIQAAFELQLNIISEGTYGATQGPRLETSAEIKRMQKDGCDLVGMTGMPEAALAQELKIDYSSICFVTNWAAGKEDKSISIEKIRKILEKNNNTINKLIKETVKLI